MSIRNIYLFCMLVEAFRMKTLKIWIPVSSLFRGVIKWGACRVQLFPPRFARLINSVFLSCERIKKPTRKWVAWNSRPRTYVALLCIPLFLYSSYVVVRRITLLFIWRNTYGNTKLPESNFFFLRTTSSNR
jgi:hypothetical protein